MVTRESLEAAIKRGISTYVRNTGAPVSETDLFSDIIVDVNRAIGPAVASGTSADPIVVPPTDGSAAVVLDTARALVGLPDLAGGPEARLQHLRRTLDRLAVAYHALETSPVPTEEHPAPERTEYGTMRARFAAAFPDLGAYHAVQDVAPPADPAEVTLGDALDDLTDIALDLEEVLARARVSVEDALWYFRFLFDAHWGTHLRFLQLYLHARER